MEQLLAEIPSYAKDLKLNLPGVLKQAELTPQQTWGTAVACAIAARNPRLAGALVAEAKKNLSPEALNGAMGAGAIMGMNNVCYRFQHMMHEVEGYSGIPARLRMMVIRLHGTDPADFELWCLAVSAINNCAMCVQAHEKGAREKGIRPEAIVAAVRIAAVIQGVAAVLDSAVAIAGVAPAPAAE